MSEYEERSLCTNDSNKNYFYQYLATLTGTFIVICSGMHSAWPSPTLPQLLKRDSYIHISSAKGSWLAVMPCLGAPFGAVFSALMINRIGRKHCILLSSPLYLVSWISIAYARSLLVLMIARFIVGIADGILFTVFPVYVAEISHRSIRGFLGASIAVSFTLGNLLINCMGLFLSIKNTALIGAIVPVIHLATYMWMPESPLFYVLNNKFEEADASLSKFIGYRSAYIDRCGPNTPDNRSQWLRVFSEKSSRKALGICMGLRVIQQFSGNFVILFYCLFIFKEAGGAISSGTATIIYFAIQLVSSILSTILVDISGRRPLLIISIIGSGITLAAQGAYFYLKEETKIDLSQIGFIPLVALVLYNILFNFGLSALPTLILSELFSTHVKGVALCLCDIVFAASVLLAAKVFQITKDQFGMHVPFFVFASCCVFGLIFVTFFLPETKGKSLNEIQVIINS